MILKLKEAGESHTMTIKACEEAKGQYGEQVKFDGTDGNTLFLPKDSADRQLGRIPLTYEEAVGLTLTFSRDPNPKKGSSPYWGIKLADAGSKAPAPSGKRLTPEQAATAKPHNGPLPTKEHDFDRPTADEEARFEAFSNAIDAVEDVPMKDTARYMAESPYADGGTGPAHPQRMGTAKEREYLQLFDRVAKHQAATCKALGIPLDASAVQASTFSIFKAQGN